MNNKLKKVGALIAIAIIVLVSSSYYENATEPSGINHEHYCDSQFYITTLKSTSYLGNNITVGYGITPYPIPHYTNLSNTDYANLSRHHMVWSRFYMTTLTSVHWPYSNPVITILNTSLSVNNTIFKNGTDKNDNFGPYWSYSVCSNNYTSCFYLYEKGDFLSSNPNFIGPPLSSILNPGNYTFYENITYTIPLSMGFMHFTSQPYHLDESWWELFAYHLKHNGKIY